MTEVSKKEMELIDIIRDYVYADDDKPGWFLKKGSPQYVKDAFNEFTTIVMNEKDDDDYE